MINKKRVKELIEDRIAELNSGLFVVDLSISPTNIISVELDKMGGNVSINDCMSVSRNVEHNLNREEEDFGRPVKVVLKEGPKVEGVLIEADAEKIILEQERLEKIDGKKKKEKITECLTFQMSEIKETKVVVLFK